MLHFDNPFNSFRVIDEDFFIRQQFFLLCVWIGALDDSGEIIIDAWILESPFEAFIVLLRWGITVKAINLVSHIDAPIFLSSYIGIL